MNPQQELAALLELFPEERPLIARADHQPAGLLPEEYRVMLAHDHHMTVTMEDYHGGPVAVSVLAEHFDEASNCYNRKILLSTVASGDVVQFGIVRFDFNYVTPQVKDEILAKETPLGRVLINHNVLRHIDLGALLRIEAGPALADYFKMPAGGITYGRLATIFCNHQPAVDLLEISAPLRPADEEASR